MKTLAGAIIILASAIVLHGVLLSLSLAVDTWMEHDANGFAEFGLAFLFPMLVVGLIFLVWGGITERKGTE